MSGFGQPDPPEHGILTGKATSPYVSVLGGSVTADGMLRIQVILNRRKGVLLFNLLDMQENGRAGAVVPVSENGECTLQGFADSGISNLSIRVNDYAALKKMIRDELQWQVSGYSRYPTLRHNLRQGRMKGDRLMPRHDQAPLIALEGFCT